jgi:hypothetical protein
MTPCGTTIPWRSHVDMDDLGEGHGYSPKVYLIN